MRIVNKTASLGEELACEYLTKKGYKIIERNFRKKYEEIDIIATHGSSLVFVEVKTRGSTSFGTPFEGISGLKLRHLAKSAQVYKMTHANLPDDMRIDAIGVILNGDKVVSVEHLENVTG